MTKTSKKLTPLMQQYWDVKSAHSDKIMFFRMGDFFELFHEDAITAAPILGCTLTSRNKSGGDNTPMCGFPHHSAGNYINKLLASNFKVAICDQVEDPKQAKGLVKRAVTRILSPGMVFDPETLDQTHTNYICSYDAQYVSFLDATTGEAFFYKYKKETDRQRLIEILRPVELVLSGEQKIELLESRKQLEWYHVSTFEKTDEKIEGNPVECVGRLLSYAQSMQGDEVLKTLAPFEERKLLKRLELAPNTIRHLEVFETYKGEKRGSLFDAINRTKTAAGARRLKNWLCFPLCDKEEIQARQQEVARWKTESQSMTDLRKLLGQMGDLERRLGKISNPSCNARDLVSLSQSLQIGLEVSQLADHPVSGAFKKCHELVLKVQKVLVEEPPVKTREGYLINKGISPALDELIDLTTDSQLLLQKLEEREKSATCISTLKVRYNNVFGYYIEVTKTHSSKVPEHYVRRQTLTNAERYTTEELTQLEAKILSAKQKRSELEYEIFGKLRADILSLAPPILELAFQWSEVDIFTSFAWLSIEQGYEKPEFNSTGNLKIQSSRHPVVEQMVQRNFVPNDLAISNGGCLLLTGPNMAGKSTLMRQVALIQILAQVGSYVPAQAANLPLFDRIYTRIGASDFLSEGLSTFMVEMQETAEMLKSATGNSLVILDEVGRGTSTYDGMSLAQAILEYLVSKVGSTTLFATHYHELTELDVKFPQIRNVHMSIHENQGDIEFLYTLKSGPADKSYGVEVAKLAGLPREVIRRAQSVLAQKETPHGPQLGLFNQMEEPLVEGDSETPSVNPIVEEIKSVKMMEITPLDALNKLSQWQKDLL